MLNQSVLITPWCIDSVASNRTTTSTLTAFRNSKIYTRKYKQSLAANGKNMTISRTRSFIFPGFYRKVLSLKCTLTSNYLLVAGLLLVKKNYSVQFSSSDCVVQGQQSGEGNGLQTTMTLPFGFWPIILSFSLVLVMIEFSW